MAQPRLELILALSLSLCYSSRRQQERRGGRPASQRPAAPAAAPLPAAAPSRPIITEVGGGPFVNGCFLALCSGLHPA